MSFFDFRFNKLKNTSWDGMKPPQLTLYTLWADLNWHNQLYKINQLNLKNRLGFLILRIIQMVAYFQGWKKGDKYEV